MKITKVDQLNPGDSAFMIAVELNADGSPTGAIDAKTIEVTKTNSRAGTISYYDSKMSNHFTHLGKIGNAHSYDGHEVHVFTEKESRDEWLIDFFEMGKQS